MFRVALTGNVASGKSTVARVWEAQGASVVDADVLARRAVEPGTATLARIVETFGDRVLRPDGTLDRPALGRIVFGDPDARLHLESIVHPEVVRLRDIEDARLQAAGAEVVVHDIPLLFEVGREQEYEMVVLVDAAREVRAERLARDRGLSPDEIRDVMRSQLPSSGKRGRADVVIQNEGTLDELRAEAERVWAEIGRRARSLGHTAGRVRVDMHMHTRASWDSRTDPDALVQRALEAGLHRICVTDHNELTGALELAERYPERIIPGEEVKTAEGVDVIGLYLREWIPKGTPARETCERIRAQGGLVYVPHPFAPGKGGAGRVLPVIEDLVDVVEAFNARLHFQGLNDRARDWAEARGLPLGAGSDAHTLGEVGHAYVEVPAFNHDARSFLAALRVGTIHGRMSSWFVHVASTVAKLVP